MNKSLLEAVMIWTPSLVLHMKSLLPLLPLPMCRVFYLMTLIICFLKYIIKGDYCLQVCWAVNHLNTPSIRKPPIIKMFLRVSVTPYFLKWGPFVWCWLFLADNWRQIKTLGHLWWKVLTAEMKVCEFQSTTMSLVTKQGQSTCTDWILVFGAL